MNAFIFFFVCAHVATFTTEWAEKDEDKEDKQAWQDDCKFNSFLYVRKY
jgi:hypothetical protein